MAFSLQKADEGETHTQRQQSNQQDHRPKQSL